VPVALLSELITPQHEYMWLGRSYAAILKGAEPLLSP
jgi:hypothetical protein